MQVQAAVAPTGNQYLRLHLCDLDDCGVAVDAEGDIYAGDFNTGVHVYAPSGEELTHFPLFGTCNLAVDTHGVRVRLHPFEEAASAARPKEDVTCSHENTQGFVFCPHCGDVLWPADRFAVLTGEWAG